MLLGKRRLLHVRLVSLPQWRQTWTWSNAWEYLKRVQLQEQFLLYNVINFSNLWNQEASYTFQSTFPWNRQKSWQMRATRGTGFQDSRILPDPRGFKQLFQTNERTKQQKLHWNQNNLKIRIYMHIDKQWFILYMKDIERLHQPMKTHATLMTSVTDIKHHPIPSTSLCFQGQVCHTHIERDFLKNLGSTFPNTFLDDLGDDSTDSKVNLRLLDPVEVPYRNPKKNALKFDGAECNWRITLPRNC